MAVSRGGWRFERTLGGVARCAVALAVGTTGLVATASPVLAADLDLVVTTTADGGAGSLREAIDLAAAATGTGTITIHLSASTYDLTTCGPDDDANASGDLDAAPTRPLVITGAGATIRQTCAGQRVLDVRSSELFTVHGVTITGGDAVGDGGGIRVDGDALLVDTTLAGNRASALPAPAETSGSPARGGGAFVNGTATVESGSVSENSVVGGNAGATTQWDFTLVGGDALGGGVFANVVQVTGTEFTQNRATGGHGAATGLIPLRGGNARGGAVHADSARITGASMVDNAALGGTSSGAGEGGAVWATSHATIAASTVRANRATGGSGVVAAPDGSPIGLGRGGAVAGASVEVTGSRFESNRAEGGAATCRECGWAGAGSAGAGLGGAIGATALVAEDVDVVDNSAFGGAGMRGGCFPPPIYLCSPTVPPGIARGGAIHVASSATLTASRITAGSVVGGTGVDASGTTVRGAATGRAIFSGGTTNLVTTAIADNATALGRLSVFSTFEATLDRTTIDGRDPLSSLRTVEVTNSTLRSTTTLLNAPDIVLTAVTGYTSGSAPVIVAETLTSRSSLLTGPGPLACAAPGGGGGVPVVTSLGGNVVRQSGTTCGLAGPGDLSADDPAMASGTGPAPNGGPTPTFVPGPDNPALDAAGPAPCGTGADQRGVSRPQGIACDAGAVEVAASVFGTVTSESTGQPLPGIVVTLMRSHPSWEIVATTRTNPTGRYSFDVPDGTYAVRFADEIGVHRRLWWTSRPTYRRSTLVTVDQGTSPPVDAAIGAARTGRLVGRTQTATGGGLAGISVFLISRADGLVAAGHTGASGYFSFTDLEPGTYYLYLLDPAGAYEAEWWGDAARRADAQTIEIASTTESVIASLDPVP